MNYRTLLLALWLTACGGSSEPPPETGDDTATADTSETGTAGDEAPALSLPNQRELEGGIVTGGQPDEDDLRAAAAAGYTMVISLRTPSEPGFEEERALATELGMRFENVPVAGADGVTAENAAAVDALLSEAGGPVILHCGSGNRAGSMISLRAFAAGQDIEASIEAGRAAGLTGLEDAVRARLTELCEADPDRSC